MIGERKAMSIHQEIARLRSQGTGKKKIARMLGVGVETIRGICKQQEFRRYKGPHLLSSGPIFTQKFGPAFG